MNKPQVADGVAVNGCRKTGNLYCSGLYPVTGELVSAAKLSFVAAIAVAETLGAHIDPDLISLKWPNDVLIKGAKTSGILLESGQHHGQKWVLIGMGINLQHHPEGTPYPATHVFEHIPRARFDDAEPEVPTARTLLPEIVSRFEHWRQKFDREGFSPVRDRWQMLAHNIPGPVTVNLYESSFSGEALGLGANGELQVRMDDGTMRKVHAGDVFFEG